MVVVPLECVLTADHAKIAQDFVAEREEEEGWEG